MATLRYELPKIWSNDPRVIDYAANILPILGLFQFFDGIAVSYGVWLFESDGDSPNGQARVWGHTPEQRVAASTL